MAGNPAALPLLASSDLVDRCLAFDDPRVTRLFMPGAPAPDDPFLGLEVAVAWCADPDGTLARALAERGASRVVVASSRPPAGRFVHVARYLAETLAPLGIDVIDSLDLPSIHASTGAERQAVEEMAVLGLDGQPFVAIHPGSGSPTKNWPAERFARIADYLDDRLGLPSVILGGPADGEVLERFAAVLGRPPRMLTDRPLAVVSAVLRRARAFLGNDSGLGHLAGLLGLPTLALFGPTDPVNWSPLGPRVRTLRSQPLADLTVECVFAEVSALLASTNRTASASESNCPTDSRAT